MDIPHGWTLWTNSEQAIGHLGVSGNVEKCSLVRTFWSWHKSLCVVETQHLEHHPQYKAWWWQHRGVETLLISRDTKDLVRVESRLDGAKSRTIPEEIMLVIGTGGGRSFTFQQDEYKTYCGSQNPKKVHLSSMWIVHGWGGEYLCRPHKYHHQATVGVSQTTHSVHYIVHISHITHVLSIQL